MSVNIGRCSIIVLSIMYMNMVAIAVEHDEDAILSRWQDERCLEDGDIWVKLIKDGGYGPRGPEWSQWYGKPLVDPQRKASLKELLAKYPNSDYADDAALLLARAKCFYDNDPAGAVKGLYQVIQDCPNGNWIAEDPVWLRIVPSYMTTMDKEGHRILCQPYNGHKGYTPNYSYSKYLIYLESHPHRTVDESKYWIAKIILMTDLKETRYQEAIGILEDVINKYKQPQFKRSAQDAEVWDSVKMVSYDRINRIEMRCHCLLVSDSVEHKDYAKVVEAGEDFLKIYNEKGYVEYMHRVIGDAYTEQGKWDKAASHYERFLESYKRKNRRVLEYQEKLQAVRRKMR